MLGYPSILTLHTIGLALLVGANIAVDLRLLGVAQRSPLSALVPLFRIMWIGLALNTVSGILLFMADAVRKAGQPVFLIKLACVAGAVVILVMIQSVVKRSTGTIPSSARAGSLAIASLVLWTGAMVAGRLMAYL